MRQDILLDDNDDELIDANGDYIEGDSGIQEAWLAVETNKGENRQFPTGGFGKDTKLRKRVGASPVFINPISAKRELTIELESDGQVKPEIVMTEDLSDLQIYVQ